jgi:hypothetical protein
LAAVTATGNTSPTSTSTAGLVITPTSDFNGSITLSLKQVTGSAGCATTFKQVNNSIVGRINFPGGNNGQNVFLGHGTSQWITTGQYNTGVGTYALAQVSSGRSNVAIGAGAFNASTTGTANTVIGGWALSFSISGTSNVALGYGAGRYLADNVTPTTAPNQCVFVGASSKSAGVGSLNQIVIGFNAVGLGDNTAVLGNTSVVKTRLQGNIETNGDYESVGTNKGLILKSPNGTRYKITVSDSGVVTAALAP